VDVIRDPEGAPHIKKVSVLVAPPTHALHGCCYGSGCGHQANVEETWKGHDGEYTSRFS